MSSASIASTIAGSVMGWATGWASWLGASATPQAVDGSASYIVSNGCSSGSSTPHKSRCGQARPPMTTNLSRITLGQLWISHFYARSANAHIRLLTGHH
jgi:hypothetical protein